MIKVKISYLPHYEPVKEYAEVKIEVMG